MLCTCSVLPEIAATLPAAPGKPSPDPPATADWLGCVPVVGVVPADVPPPPHALTAKSSNAAVPAEDAVVSRVRGMSALSWVRGEDRRHGHSLRKASMGASRAARLAG